MATEVEEVMTQVLVKARGMAAEVKVLLVGLLEETQVRAAGAEWEMLVVEVTVRAAVAVGATVVETAAVVAVALVEAEMAVEVEEAAVVGAVAAPLAR